MISILIPNYNYSIEKLVSRLLNQLESKAFPWEILVQDDASSDLNIQKENQNFIQNLGLPQVQYHILEENIGNGNNRNLLGEKAQYDWLLYLDTDTIPKNKDFLQLYLNEIEEGNPKVVSGGIVYPESFKKEFPLKYKHGQTEVLKWEENDESNLQFRGNNFLIHKEIKKNTHFGSLVHSYGYVDTFFALALKKKGIRVKMIDNPVYHNDGVDAQELIEKKEKSLDNLVYQYFEDYKMIQDIKIVRVYERLKAVGIDFPLAWVFEKMKPMILRNLYGNTPSYYLLQMYQLGYFTQSMKASKQDSIE